jgi:hypothetical protein
MRPAFVRGASLWTEASGEPGAALLPSRLRRRTSRLTRIIAEALGSLAASTRVDLSRVAIVHGTAFGEIDTTATLLEMMHEEDGALSPTRFHNSVHNTAPGYVSIATENRGFSTSVAAGSATVAAVVLEAFGVLRSREDEVVVVMADEPIPRPLAPDCGYEALAVALHLAVEPSQDPQPRLSGLRRAQVGGPTEITPAHVANPCAPALALVRACGRGVRTTVGLEHGSAFGWCIDVEPGGG